MFRGILACVACLFAAAASAAEPVSAWEAEMNAAIEEVQKNLTPGPVDVPLTEQAVLKLSDKYLFIPKDAGSRYMRAVGNSIDERFVGLVVPADDRDWMVSVEYEAAGYIEDDDAKDWDADDLLSSLKEGTKIGNERRRERGIPELEIVGWVEKPSYDAQTHRLVWSIAAREVGGEQDGQQVINYNTYALGREGYFTLNLITGIDQIGEDKAAAHDLLGALEYNPGKRYADFDPATDRVAEYGLAALVTGIAAKKLGLFAVIGAFIAKFFKVFAIGAVVLGGAVMKLFGRKGQ